MRKQENEKVLLGRRIRALRNAKGWTQEKLGGESGISYKFIGEIERGLQNPSFETLVKIAAALRVALPALVSFEQETLDKKSIESRISQIVKILPDEEMSRLHMVLLSLYPIQR
jgi:transcriptional regulator with XRE-family HTH domain